jgi:hypothetical protein
LTRLKNAAKVKENYKKIRMAVAKAYFVLDGPGNAAVQLTENYTAIAADLGLSGKSTLPIVGKSVMRTSVLIGARAAGRIRISFKTGVKTRSSRNIFCAASKMEEAIDSVVGKEFGLGQIIISASYPRRAVFY